MWSDLSGLLAGRFRVIAPDLLGAGDSDQPRDAPLDLAAQSGYVGELLDLLSLERVAAVGEGFGGGVAQLLALDGRADALVLLNPVVHGHWPSELARTLLGEREPDVAGGDPIGRRRRDGTSGPAAGRPTARVHPAVRGRGGDGRVPPMGARRSTGPASRTAPRGSRAWRSRC